MYKIFIALAALVSLSGVADAGCGQFFSKARIRVIAPLEFVSPVYYRVGEQYRGAQQVQQLQERIAKLEQALSQSASVQRSESSKYTAIQKHCASCHSGSTPKAGLFVDGSATLPATSVTHALRLMSERKMPPNKRLTGQEMGDVMEELLRLEHRESDPEPAPASSESTSTHKARKDEKVRLALPTRNHYLKALTAY